MSVGLQPAQGGPLTRRCDERSPALAGLLRLAAGLLLGLHAQLRLPGLVLEDQAFQHRLRGGALVIVELLQRLELSNLGVRVDLCSN